jgi:hypothetical protein
MARTFSQNGGKLALQKITISQPEDSRKKEKTQIKVA